MSATTCTYCELKGAAMDPHPAFTTRDGRISCIVCERSSMPLVGDARKIFSEPQLIRDLVAELISTSDVSNPPFTLNGIISGEGHGLVAHGLTLDDILTTVILSVRNVRVEISFTGHDIKFAEKPDG